MPTSRTIALGILLSFLLWRAEAFADPPRLSILFRPSAGAGAVAVEITETVPQGLIPFKSLKFVSGRYRPELGDYTARLPAFSLGGLALNPRYGDQRLSFDFPSSAISGMGIESRSVRGLTFTTGWSGNTATVLLGSLAASGRGLFESPMPRVMALTSTLKPKANLVVAPRAVIPLGATRSSGSAEPTVGVGLRSALSPHLSLVADLGRARAHAGQWMQSVAAGLFGQWARASFDISRRHTDGGFTILGPVGFAAQDRRSASTRLVVARGITIEGSIAAFRPTGGSTSTPLSLTRASAFRIDRIPRGALALTLERTTKESKGGSTIVVEWRDPGPTNAMIQFRQQREIGGPRSHFAAQREVRVQLRTPRSNPRQPLVEVRNNLKLSGSQAGEPRAQLRLIGSVPITSRLAVAADIEQSLFTHAGHYVLRSLRLGTDFTVSGRTGIRVSYTHAVNSAVPLWKRFEATFTRSLSS